MYGLHSTRIDHQPFTSCLASSLDNHEHNYRHVSQLPAGLTTASRISLEDRTSRCHLPLRLPSAPGDSADPTAPPHDGRSRVDKIELKCSDFRQQISSAVTATKRLPTPCDRVGDQISCDSCPSNNRTDSSSLRPVTPAIRDTTPDRSHVARSRDRLCGVGHFSVPGDLCRPRIRHLGDDLGYNRVGSVRIPIATTLENRGLMLFDSDALGVKLGHRRVSNQMLPVLCRKQSLTTPYRNSRGVSRIRGVLHPRPRWCRRQDPTAKNRNLKL